jgi:hypothetical protein
LIRGSIADFAALVSSVTALKRLESRNPRLAR